MPGGKHHLNLPPLLGERLNLQPPVVPRREAFIFGNQAHRSGEMQLLADEVIE